MIREDGRTHLQIRPIKIIPNYIDIALGSVLIEVGKTRVICTVSVEEGVPNFLRNTYPLQGWLTAEYAMLPASSFQRIKRERPAPSGRSQEIQRMIGRALRGIIDLSCFSNLTLYVDCDVIQADGGTRTASINGSYVALSLACKKLLRDGKIKTNPIKDSLAAISIGLKNNEFLFDLNYKEDSTVDLDMNIVMTGSGKVIEIQGTGERASFSKEQLFKIIEQVQTVITPIFDLQSIAIDGAIAEG